MTKKGLSSKELALICAHAAIDKKSENSIIFDVSKIGAFTDCFLITSGASEKQTQAISDEIVRVAKQYELGKPTVEGYEQGRWILLDFGSVIVHIFHDYIREFYHLEDLWANAPKVGIPQDFYTSPLSAKVALVQGVPDKATLI